MHNNSKLKKFLCCIITIIVVVLTLFISYLIAYNVNSKADVAASTSENCELLHNIYIKRDFANRTFVDIYLTNWKEYSEGTLYNLGLFENNSGFLEKGTEKKWNGKWIIDEDFIKQYIEKYSIEEFIEIYNLYIHSYLKPLNAKLATENIDTDEKFYKQNNSLLIKISEVTTILFEQTDLFEVVSYHPTTDKILSTTSETIPVQGTFNVGNDNHIETKTAELTTDTYQYNGYIVEHIHGSKYVEGEYGWRNGQFIDIKSYFEPVNEYRLYVDGNCVIGPAENLENLERSWIVIGEKNYYEQILYGGTYISNVTNYSKSFEFSQPISVLVDSSRSATHQYLAYR